MTNIEIVLAAIAVCIFYKMLNEIVHIRLYSLIIKLKAEGKLIPETNSTSNVNNANTK